MNDKELNYLTGKDAITAQRDIILTAIKYGCIVIALIIVAVLSLTFIFAKPDPVDSMHIEKADEYHQSQSVIVEGKNVTITQRSNGGGNNVVMTGDNATYYQK